MPTLWCEQCQEAIDPQKESWNTFKKRHSGHKRYGLMDDDGELWTNPTTVSKMVKEIVGSDGEEEEAAGTTGDVIFRDGHVMVSMQTAWPTYILELWSRTKEKGLHSFTDPMSFLCAYAERGMAAEHSVSMDLIQVSQGNNPEEMDRKIQEKVNEALAKGGGNAERQQES